MNKFRNTLAIITCLCMVSAFCVTAIANDGTAPLTIMPIVDSTNGPFNAPMGGDSDAVVNAPANVVVIEPATLDVPYILVETTTEPIMQIKLNMTYGIVLNTQTGELMDLTELEAGDNIVAYYSTAITRSMPPIANCDAIVANIGDTHAPAMMLGVGNITKNEDGSLNFLSTDGAFMITIPADADVAYASGLTVGNIDDIANKKVFVWFDIAAMSYPARAKTDRVLVINRVEKPVAPIFELEANDANAFIYIDDNFCQKVPADPKTELVLDAAPTIVDGCAYSL